MPGEEHGATARSSESIGSLKCQRDYSSFRAVKKSARRGGKKSPWMAKEVRRGDKSMGKEESGEEMRGQGHRRQRQKRLEEDKSR